MPLDGYKTQVLLLHSEQSALDSLSSGFGDSFTVHCATSGSEALNTLGETPINVIVTAQDLPGMSGLEALREAKKRSPETIGILLAGDADDGLEALVGDKEVFQVIRGNVTSDSISRLVENATQEMRLTTLASSANDAAANVDEPADQHIVMETSDTGASIISDGSGAVPVLDPTGTADISPAGSHAIDLLVLTKDGEFLDTIKESSRGTHSVHYANTLAQADKLIREYTIGVAVVDAAMVGERIEQLTLHLRKGSPRLVAVVAGRRDDGEMMMDLINRSKVYRFLLKPVSPGRARLAIEASVKHHLEAPDSAFKIKGSAAPVAADSTAAAADRESESERQTAAPSDKTSAEASASQTPVTPDRRTGPPSAGGLTVDDALSETFDRDDSALKKTVTGLFNTAKRKMSDGDDSDRAESVDTATSAGGSALKNPRILGMGAVAIMVIAGAFFWMSGGDDRPLTAPDITATTPAAVAPAVTDSDAAPGNESPAADPAPAVGDGAGTAADSGTLVAEALADAEAAMLELRTDDAAAALELVRSADPENSRLPFLSAQLAQLQLREFLTEARDAIREKRFEDASVAIETARLLELPDYTEIVAAEDELSNALSSQQIDDVLAMANTRLEDGNLLEPANDNARYYFEMALSSDPQNAAARQGLSVIASKLALKARSETDDGNLDAAQALLVDAKSLDPNNSEIGAAVAALAAKRDEIAERRRQQAAERRRAEAARKEAEARAAAERKAEQQRAAELAAAPPPAQEAAEPAADDAANTASSQTTADDAQTLGPDAGSEATASGATSSDANAGAAEDAESTLSLTSVTALKRTKYVAPKYPRAAERRNLSGWVDVVFTVDRGGLVKDVTVRDSEPGETFVNAAVKAISKWEFEPIVENGEVVEKRAGVRLMFALE